MKIYFLLNIVFIIICVWYMFIEQKIMRKQRIFLLWTLIFEFSILMAMRPLETKDTIYYVDAFNFFSSEQSYNVNFLQKYNGSEFGYIYLIRIFKRISLNYRLFFFLISFLGTSLSIFGLKRLLEKIDLTKEYAYGSVLVLYVSKFGFLYNGISVRAGLSMGIGVVAICLMLEKKRISSVLLFFFAFTIHRTSVLFAVIYLIVKFMPRLKKKTHIWMWTITGIMLMSGFGSTILHFIVKFLNLIIIKFNITGYSGYLADSMGLGKRDIFNWCLYGMLIFFCISSEYYERYLNVILCGVILIVFMHDIRAFSRAYDMFYLFIVPTFGALFVNGSYKMLRRQELLILSVISVNAVIMLKLSFF